MKWVGGAIGVLVAVLIVAFLVLRTPDTDPAAMKLKYGGEAARYAEGEDGLVVHYRDQGERDADAIVFIHGSSASLHTWEPVMERLGQRYRVIAYDQPGHGLTGPHPNDDYSADGMFEALDAVMADAGIERAALVGNSMGGWVAWRYALENPERVPALVLLDASGAPLPESAKPELPIGFKIVQSPVGRWFAQYVTPRSIVEKSAKASVYDESIVDDQMVDRYWELLRYPGNRRATMARATTNREADYADRLAEIAAPTLILWGEEDKLVPVEAARVFDARIPNSFALIYKNVGHIPMEEVPANVAADIDAFLRDVLVY